MLQTNKIRLTTGYIPWCLSRHKKIWSILSYVYIDFFYAYYTTNFLYIDYTKHVIIWNDYDTISNNLTINRAYSNEMLIMICENKI